LRQVANAVVSTFVAGLIKAVDAYLDKEPEAKGVEISHGRLYLMDDEAAALNRDLDRLVQRYATGRTSRHKPADATPRDQYWLLLPHESPRGR